MRGGPPLRRAASLGALLAWLLTTAPALADKVAVLPFTSPSNLSPPERERARSWTRDAVLGVGHTVPSPSEQLSGEMAVKDGLADTSVEYRAVGRASGSTWTIAAHVDRVEVAATKTEAGPDEDGFTLYRLELQACQVETGRVESLARDIDPDDALAEIAPMLALLIRPEGIANAELPWDKGPRKRKAKPKPAPEPPEPGPPPPPPTPREPPPPEPPARGYGEGHPVALGLLVGASDALVRPSVARGPSLAMPVGAVFGYALENAPGLEVRAIVLTHAVGPRAFEASAGARYAVGITKKPRLFVGPEVLAGAHVALGGGRDARFLLRTSAFLSYALTERLYLEVAGDLASAFGGSGTLVLGGGTGRVLVRF